MEAHVDTSYLPTFCLETLGEDARYYVEVLERRPQVFFRIGDRTSPNDSRHWPITADGIGYLGFITHYGSHVKRQLPTYLPERLQVRLHKRETKPLRAITPAECAEAYRELATPADVLAYLRKKYPDTPLTPDSTVTVYTIEYL